MDSLTTVKLLYSLLSGGDNSGALQLLDPQVEWTEAERTPYFNGTMIGFNGTMIGPDAIIGGLFAPLACDFENFTTTPSDFVTESDRVVSFGRYKGVRRSNGSSMSAPFVHLWTVSNGRLRRFVQFTDSAAWNEAI
jgi:uncharacterized protein